MPRVNHGALFGMGGDQKGTANGLFAGISLAAAVAILVWGMRRKHGPREVADGGAGADPRRHRRQSVRPPG